MEQEKRKIIVREIEHWRRSRLLPEHYCDFLLNLYDADPAERDTRAWGVSKNAIQNSNWKHWAFGIGITALIAYLAFYFNSFRFPMQIMSALGLVIGCYAAGFAYRRKHPAAAQGLVGAGSVALLGAGVYLLRRYELDEAALMMAYVTLCCFVWIIVGLLSRMGLFQYCGWMGLTLVYGLLLHDRAELGWIGAQASWLPLCLLFGWFGWLLHKSSKSTGAVLLLVCFTLWWMPEAYLFLTNEPGRSLLQLLLPGKLVIAGAVLFGLRKKWIEWVF